MLDFVNKKTSLTDEVKEVIGGEPGIEEKPASEIKKEEKEEVEESKEATETPLQEDLVKTFR